ncbi:integrase, catalytic region, zinc finger, CCHC-type containing protein [Tanacetum coccineum]
MDKLENENVCLKFQVQSLLKERDNVKMEYQKLFDSIKNTRTQSQREINELIESVNQKTYAYGDVRVQNQDLLITISELKAKLKNAEKGESVNTKFDKPSVSGKLLCVTPIKKQVVIQIVLWIVDSGCSKHMTGNLKFLKNFIVKFMGTVCFSSLGHNIFSVGQFYDSDLEVAFRSKTCYVRNLEGDDLLTATTKSRLWHRRLSHLNFGTINHLTKQDLVDGLLKFKYDKDHLCSTCEQGKSKKETLQPKLVPSTHSKSSEVSINSAAQTTLNNEDTPSSSSIIIEENEAPPLVSSSEEQISPNSNDVAIESVHEDTAELDKNTWITPFNSPSIDESESSSTTQNPSNMHDFNQVHPSSHT